MNRFFSAFVWMPALACVARGNTSTVEKPDRALWLSQHPPAVWLFAVDDVADARGDEMRARLWTDLANNTFWGSCDDPAEYYATDRRVGRYVSLRCWAGRAELELRAHAGDAARYAPNRSGLDRCRSWCG